ncbi:multidrug transporter [Kosmotoga arenicorallina S304]|uniref:Multidrug transporter n=1 Tax=Kosmotoga arenicorallina S304 TaxID=1453497 RepID=A0A176K1H2_9BACT|nr:DMT family transporter [Kosmotoga arenicorallina]OAA30749.1 multidrug transporter [Kosmotoga arenicorallina S304]
MKINPKSPLSAAIMAILASVLWGSAFPVLKISFSELNISSGDISEKLVFAGMRFLIAGLMLFIFSSRMRKVGLRLKGLFGLFLLGLLQTSLQYTLFYNGLSNTSGVKSSIIIASGNFFVVLLAHFVYKNDKINMRKIIGLSAGFSGIFLANIGKGLSLDITFSGEGLLILSTLVGAVGTILAKELSKKFDPFAVSGWQMLMGSIFLIGIGLPGMEKGLRFTPLAFFLLLYSSFLSAAAFSLWYTVLKYNKAGEVTIYRFIIPLSGAVFSALFIPGESFTASILIALGLAVTGIVAVNYRRN